MSHEVAKIQTWKCVVCDKSFKVGEWTCQDGLTNHVVEAKIYRSCDAPTDPGHKPGGGDLETSGYGMVRVCNIPPPKKVMEGNDVKWVGEGYVEFIRGRFSSTDPEIQYWLDKKPNYNASEEQWQSSWLSKKQQLDLREQSLIAERERLENERNDLLSQVKQQKRA